MPSRAPGVLPGGGSKFCMPVSVPPRRAVEPGAEALADCFGQQQWGCHSPLLEFMPVAASDSFLFRRAVPRREAGKEVAMNAGIVGIAFLVLVVLVEVFQHRVT